MSNLQDPVKQPGFGRGEHFRAYTAAEKIAATKELVRYYTRGNYNPATDLGPTPRAGSTDAHACPSRIGDVLHYRSGEVELDVIPHNPKPVYSLY